ncbi:uncharacterized protein LOC142616228 [Castanea sativa]|uniref:uncharacterized protein LOC142616228 n=1 Tax=Castanea sativa TaxID=21020 RepID=UPI003F64A5FE
MRDVVLKKEMKFPNAKVFRAALREYVIKKPIDIKFKLNERTKISVHCKNVCGWRCYASQISGELTFQIKTLTDDCNCPKSFKNSQAKSAYVAKRFIEDFSKNPNWETEMTDETSQPKFKRMYVRFNAQKVGFLGGCRPFVGLDGRPEEFQLVFISDRQKGLIPAIETLFPTVKHKYCVKHIYNNFKVDHKGLELKDALWRCAAATTSKDKPILAMLEWIRVRLMTRLYIKREGIEKDAGKLCPSIQDKLEKLKVESKPFSATPAGSFLYEVAS